MLNCQFAWASRISSRNAITLSTGTTGSASPRRTRILEMSSAFAFLIRTFEKLVHGGYGHRTLANSKSDALRTAATAIPGREHTGQACFDCARRSEFLPYRQGRNLLASQQVALLVSHNGRGKETGSGFCSNKNEEARSKLLHYFSVRFAYAHSADMLDAFD